MSGAVLAVRAVFGIVHQPKKRAEAERSPEGEPEAGGSVKGTGGTENGHAKARERSEPERRLRGWLRCLAVVGADVVRTVTGTGVKVTPTVLLLSVLSPESRKTGVPV